MLLLLYSQKKYGITKAIKLQILRGQYNESNTASKMATSHRTN